MMLRPRIALVIVVLLALGGLAWIVIENRAGTAAPAADSLSGANSRSSAQILTPDSAARIENALNSDEESDQLSALAPELRGPAAEQGLRLLPAGSKLRLLSETFEQTGNAATVTAELGDGRRFVLIMTQADAEWLIVATEDEQ